MFRKATALLDEQDHDQAQECAQLAIQLFAEVYPETMINDDQVASDETKDKDKDNQEEKTSSEGRFEKVKKELKKSVIWTWTYFDRNEDEENPEDGPIIYRSEVAACYSLIAAIHHHYEELEDAKLLYERTYEVYREIRMEESAEMAKVCHNLGAVYDDMVSCLFTSSTVFLNPNRLFFVL
jgi:tetratricopeptide (TPR) repeat protein